MLSRLHTPDSSQPGSGADPAGPARPARPVPQKQELPKAPEEVTTPQHPLDPALTGEFGPQPATSERRRAILPQARSALQDPALRHAYEGFVRAATDLAEAGMVFEMVHRSAPEGGMAPREPRNLSVAAVPEKGIEKDCQTVVLMGVGFWEFLPGYFYGSERVIEGSRIAMDVGSFRFVESTPSGDAEIIGQTDAGPLAQYMRIDVSGDGLVKSLAISNAALGGAFVAAYRAYIEVLAGCPYKMLHPYRQLGAPVVPKAEPVQPPPQPQPQPQRPAPPRAAAPLSARRSAPERDRHPGLVWGWLAVPPALAAAYLLGMLVTGQRGAPTPTMAPPPSAEAPPAAPRALPSAPSRPPAPSAPAPEPPAATPSPADDPTALPLPPPPPPPPPEAAAPPPSPAPPPSQVQPAPAAPPAAIEAPPATPPPPNSQLGGMWRPGVVTQDSNVRAAPFGGAPVLRVVPGGTQVRIIESSEGWLRVALPDGRTLGWIYGGLVQ